MRTEGRRIGCVGGRGGRKESGKEEEEGGGEGRRKDGEKIERLGREEEEEEGEMVTKERFGEEGRKKIWDLEAKKIEGGGVFRDRGELRKEEEGEGGMIRKVERERGKERGRRRNE